MSNPNQYTAYLEENLIDTMPETGKSFLLFAERHPGDFHLPKGSMDMPIDDNIVGYCWPLTEEDIATSMLPRVGLRDIQKHPLSWRLLKKAEITNQQRGVKLDILEKLPKGCDVYFPAVPHTRGSNFYSTLDNVIRLDIGINSAEALFALTHEATHAERSSKEHPTRLHRTMAAIALKGIVSGQFGDKRHATLLEDETETWAGAFDMLEPFMSDDPAAILNPATLKAYVHQNLAANSSDIIRERRR